MSSPPTVTRPVFQDHAVTGPSLIPMPRRPWPLAAIVAALAGLVFVQVPTLDFVTWDDNVHIYQNPYFSPITSTHLVHFWVAPYHGLYIPLAYALFAGLAAISRLPASRPALTETGAMFDPHMFHAAGLLFHVVNTLLAFFLIRRCVRRDLPAAAGALLFALHPLQVESVAWASELRGLSCASLCLSCLLLALPRTSADRSAAWRQAGAVVLGTAALFCKPTAVVLPLAIIVLDRWFFGRTWKSGLRVTAPLLALGIAFVGITQRIQSVPPEFLTPVWTRPFIAGDALAFYVRKLLLPVGLGIDYGRTPQWVMAHPQAYTAWLVPAGVAALAVLVSRRSASWLGGGLMLGTILLAPVLGLTPFAFQEYSTVADRYVYLALIGPALILACALRAAEGDPTTRRIAYASAAVGLCLLGVLSFRQVGVWRTTGTLMRNALEVNDRSDLAFFDYGDWLDRHGRIKAAVAAYQGAIQANPASYPARLRLSQDDFTLGRFDESRTEADQARQIDPAAFTPHILLGNAYAGMGRLDDAVAEYRNALQREPDDAETHINLGIVLQTQGKTAVAIYELQQAVRAGGASSAVHANLGDLLMGAGRTADALSQFRAAVSLQPNSAILHALTGDALAAQGDIPAATAEYRAALSLDPASEAAHAGLRRIHVPAAR